MISYPTEAVQARIRGGLASEVGEHDPHMARLRRPARSSECPGPRGSAWHREWQPGHESRRTKLEESTGICFRRSVGGQSEVVADDPKLACRSIREGGAHAPVAVPELKRDDRKHDQRPTLDAETLVPVQRNGLRRRSMYRGGAGSEHQKSDSSYSSHLFLSTRSTEPGRTLPGPERSAARAPGHVPWPSRRVRTRRRRPRGRLHCPAR